MRDLSRLCPAQRGRVLLFVLLAVLLAGGGLLLWSVLSSQQPASPVASSRQRTVTLYFAAANGAGLVAETRQIPDSPIEDECLRATVQALIDGPTGNFAPVLPRQTMLRCVTLVGSELHVEFSRELVDAHPGGSWGELLTVQALVNTMAISFPQVRQVRILVEGVAIETLKGHIDLRQPVAPDFTLVLKAPAVGSSTTPVGKPQ